MIDSITAEDNLTFVTINAINCDESGISVVLNAVAKAGIKLYPVAAAPSYKSYISVSFCIEDKDLAVAVAALGGIKDTIADFHCCITGDVTKISICADGLDSANIIKALADGGIRIRFLTFDKDGLSLYTSGVYTGMALNVLKQVR